MQLVDSKGSVIRLGRELGRGGEGAVFEIADDPRHVAKVYHQVVDREKSEKLEVMASMPAHDLQGFCAWPLQTLRESPSRGVIGIVLPHIRGSREIHNLYSPAHRKQLYPKADWRFLIRAARNCATSFAKLHGRGVVIGDVNQGNVLVDEQALVQMIDCDSFQVQSSGRCFRCRVAVPHFVPPELQGRSLGDLDRTHAHDCFGLALIIFHLLFMGRHPYAGRYSGKGDMPIETAIKEHRFAYGSNSRNYSMTPPPKTAPLAILPGDLIALFEQAFSPEASRGTRPNALQWSGALERLEGRLKPCPYDPGHYFYSALSTCPWCELVRSGAPNPFIVFRKHSNAAPSKPFDFESLWRQIEAVPSPFAVLESSMSYTVHVQGAVPPSFVNTANTQHDWANALLLGGGGVTVLALLAPLFLWIGLPVLLAALIWRWRLHVTSPSHRYKVERRERLKVAEAALHTEEQKLRGYIRKFNEDFTQMRRSLDSARQRYLSAEQQMQQDIAAITRNARQLQLDEYLRQNYLMAGVIEGIGPGLIATLESFGIETAYDVNVFPLLDIPGFGEVRIQRLLAWRAVVEARFRFDASKSTTGSAEQQIRARCEHTQHVCENELRRGPHSLWGLTQNAQRSILASKSHLDELMRKVAQAKADYAVVS